MVFMDRPVSNSVFGRAVGVHFTTASRYRSGERVPSTLAILRIVNAYNLDAHEALEMAKRGPAAFGHFLRMHVFGPEPGLDVDAQGNEISFDLEEAV